MRIRSWEIDGFGLFHELSSGDLPHGLIIVFSPDEDRKRAMLRFLRGMLFGLQNGSWALNDAPDGAGSLVIEGLDGEYRLRRDTTTEPPSLIFPDGHSEGVEQLERMIGGATRTELRHIFDVALGDLRAFASPNGHTHTPTMTPPAAIDSAAVARSVIQNLRRRGAQLLSGNGGSRIDALLVDLEKIECLLADAQSQENEYADRVREERAAREEVGRLCALLAEKRQRRERFQLLLDLWPLWKPRMEAERTLISLDPIDDFPDEEMGLVEASRDFDAAQRNLNNLRQEHEHAERALAELKPAGDRFEMAEEVDAICAQLPAYRSKLTAFATARARHGELQRLLPQSADEVAGNGGAAPFDPAKLDLKEARGWHLHAQELSKRQSQTRSMLETARTDLRELRAAQEEAVEEDTDPGDPFDLRWLLLWRLRRHLDDLWEVQSQGEAKARTAEEKEQALAQLAHGPSRNPIRGLRPCMWAIVAGSFLGALWMVGKEEIITTWLLSGVAALAMAADFALGWRSHVAQVRKKESETAELRLRWEMQHAEHARDASWTQAGDLAEKVRTTAAALSLPTVPDLDKVEAYEIDLWRQCKSAVKRGPLTQIALSLKEKEDSETLLTAQLIDLRDATEHANREWEAWKTVVGLPARLQQEELTTYLCQFDRWFELHREADEIDAELQRLAPQIGDWEDRARQTLMKVGVNVNESLCGRDLVDRLTMLRDSVVRSEQLRRRRIELESEVASTAKNVDRAEKHYVYCKAMLARLSARAGTTDHAEFERRSRIYDRRRELRAEIELQDRVLAVRLDAVAKGQHDKVCSELADADPELWQEEGRQIDRMLADMERDLEVASKQQIEASAICRRQEESNGVASLQQQHASLLSELSQAANEWRKLALAEGLIENTLSEFDRHQRSGLLALVSESVKGATAGRFTQVLAENGNGSLSLIDQRGQQHAVPGGVERNVAQQVCLSMHLGLVREMSQRSITAPLVLDEVLGDLDRDQARTTAAEVIRLSDDHQILFFTSNQATVEALRDAGPIARIVEI